MDMEKIMILCKGEDKTQNIADYTIDQITGKYLITYCNGTSYQYNRENVKILLKPQQKTLLDGQLLYHRGVLVSGAENILLFKDRDKKYIRTFRQDAPPISGAYDEFRILKNAASSEFGQRLLKYWRDIAQHLEDGKQEEDNFLAKKFDQLNAISEESALAAYIGGKPIHYVQAPAKQTIFPFNFNLSQKKALENALTYSISIIEGPPGTGKTQTILNILANLIAIRGKSVGVVSFNNEAVKNIRDKMEKGKEEGKPHYGFLIADLGRREKRENFFAEQPQVDVDGWNDPRDTQTLLKTIHELNQTLDRLLSIKNKHALLQQELDAYRLEQQYFNRYYMEQNITAPNRSPFQTNSSETILDYLADTLLAERSNVWNTFRYKLKLLFKYHIFRFWRHQRDSFDMRLNFQKRFYDLKISELERDLAECARLLQESSFETLMQKQQQLSDVFFRKKLYESYHGSETAAFSITDYKARFSDFIKKYPIILSTNHSLRDSIPKGYLLDYLIIDEASQVDLLTGVLALSCCKNLIIVGDMKQLPQIVDSSIKEKIDTAGVPDVYDYFNHNILSSFIALYGKQLPKTMLREHYRCHPKIIGFCNQKYYNGKLIPLTDSSLSKVPLLLYKTSTGGHMREVTSGEKNKGRYNQRELDTIEQEVLTSLHLSLSTDSVGFATPYRKQVSKAQALFSKSIKSDTVHKYQGREEDIIIMSTVLDNTRRGEAGIFFVDDPNLINVAVSRAVKQFVLVTDPDLFLNKGTHVRDLIKYIQYNTLDAHIVDSQVVSVFDLLYKNYSKKLYALQEKLPEHSIYRSENIVYALLEEILAEERYCGLSFCFQVYLCNLIQKRDLLTAEENKLIDNGASVDFVIFNKHDKKCECVIEVDGFSYHENNPAQLKRDQLKDSILKKYSIPILRLPTNGSGEKEKICKLLNSL